MRQLINVLTGLLIGLLPVAGITIIGIVVVAAIPNIAGKIIFVLLEVLSLWLGFKIFKKIQVVGPIEFLTAIIASPDMDNLEPTEDSETKRRSSEELVNLINNNNNLFKGGAFRIFGDWFGKPYDNYYSIESADFNSELNKLTLVCKEGESLEIFNPNHIFEAPTFLKIIYADRIKLTWYCANPL